MWCVRSSPGPAGSQVTLALQRDDDTALHVRHKCAKQCHSKCSHSLKVWGLPMGSGQYTDEFRSIACSTQEEATLRALQDCTRTLYHPRPS